MPCFKRALARCKYQDAVCGWTGPVQGGGHSQHRAAVLPARVAPAAAGFGERVRAPGVVVRVKAAALVARAVARAALFRLAGTLADAAQAVLAGGRREVALRVERLRASCFGTVFRPLSSCRGYQAALKRSDRGDRVTRDWPVALREHAASTEARNRLWAGRRAWKRSGTWFGPWIRCHGR